jgi:hypothetical protein
VLGLRLPIHREERHGQEKNDDGGSDCKRKEMLEDILGLSGNPPGGMPDERYTRNSVRYTGRVPATATTIAMTMPQSNRRFFHRL